MIKIAKKKKTQYLISLKREQEMAVEKGWKVSRTKSYLEVPQKAIGKKGYPYAVLNKEKSYETFYTWKEKPSKKAKKKVKATKGYKWETSKGTHKGHTETWDVLKPKKSPKKKRIISGRKKKGNYIEAPQTRKRVEQYMEFHGLSDKGSAKNLRHLGKLKNKSLKSEQKKKEKPYAPKKVDTKNKSMKEIIEELKKPPKPSGKTYISGIIKEQNKYKKIEQKEEKRLAKSIKKALFKKPTHKKYAEMISFKNPTQARISARKLRKEFREAKQKAKQLRIARATQYASNRAKASSKRKNLNIDERKQIKEIGKIYDTTANSMWYKYKTEKPQKKAEKRIKKGKI